MGQQFQELLRDVDRKLDGVEKFVGTFKEDLKEELKEIEEQLGLLRERIATLEEAKRWTGEERRKVDGRLETGDKTFERIAYEVKAAEDAAERAYSMAKTALDAIGAHTTGVHGETKRKKSKLAKAAEFLFPYLWPLLLTAVAWLFQHLMFLAELAKAAKEGRP